MRSEDAKRLCTLLDDDARGVLGSDEGYRELLRLRDEWESSPAIDDGRMTRAQRERLEELDDLCDEADDGDWNAVLDEELRKLAALSMTEWAARNLEKKVRGELGRNDASAAAGRALSARLRQAYAAYRDKFGDWPHYYRLHTTEMLCDAMERAVATGRELEGRPGAIG